jgi:Predicted ATPase of the PP-loop superfamily implicated in cell cycle control
MKICKKCLLSSTYPNIKFNEEGVCNFCEEHIHINKLGQHYGEKKKELDSIIDKAIEKRKSTGAPYDIIVPLSGGKDSAYVAYYLKKNYDVNILGLTYDNGFLTDYAKENVWNIADKLDIDVVMIKPKISLMKKLYKAMLEETKEFCNVCNSMGYLLIASYVSNLAVAWGDIPLVALGWVRRYEMQEGIQSFSIPEFFEIMKKHNLADEILADSMINGKAISKFFEIKDPRKTDNQSYMSKTGWNVIQLPDYIDWDVAKVVETLETELEWKIPGNKSDPAHFDCKCSKIKEFLKYKKHGITQKTIINSKMVRDDRMSRENALEILENENHGKPEFWDDFVAILGVDGNQYL